MTQPPNDPYRHWDGQKWLRWDGAAWVPEVPTPAQPIGPPIPSAPLQQLTSVKDNPQRQWNGQQWVLWNGVTWVPEVIASLPVSDPTRQWDGRQWLRWDGAAWRSEAALQPAPATMSMPVSVPKPATRNGRKWGLIIAVMGISLVVVGAAIGKAHSRVAVLTDAYNACVPHSNGTAASFPGVQLEDQGATLTVDTKGEKDSTGASIVDLACLLVAAKAPSSVTANMDNTRALDGAQTAQWGDIKATWRYHPDDGFNLVLTTN